MMTVFDKTAELFDFFGSKWVAILHTHTYEQKKTDVALFINNCVEWISGHTLKTIGILFFYP